MIGRRIAELIAITMIGEGVIGSLKPRKYLMLWDAGPQPVRNFVRGCANRPDLMRWVFLAVGAVGVWLAHIQLPDVRDRPARRFWGPKHARRRLLRVH